MSDFPRLGQKVVAIKTGGSYLFYAYLPGSNSLDVAPSNVKDFQLNGKKLIYMILRLQKNSLKASST
ncbi:MAG: hypothetical protein ACI4NE_00940, partial [Succinivibrio sp.]